MADEAAESSPTRNKALPRIRFLGRFPINFVKVYDSRLILKASAANGGDNPELFLDLESPQPSFTQQNCAELHLGIAANFRLEQSRNSAVKPHIDIYLPASEIPRLLKALGRAEGDRRGCHKITARWAR